MSNVLPSYLAMGVSEEKFWDSAPSDLKPYEKAYELKQKIKDADMWQMGIYFMSAMQTVAQHAICGKKSQAEYLKEPLLSTTDSKEKVMTEDEKKKERDKLLMTLQLMQANFELSHKEGK